MDILRFTTAGNVDDGKSTLIGRLLYDTNNLKSDILKSVSGKDEDAAINLAHITDGLRSERAQGITIDVAYKYFTTPARKYIITDAPGHFQYTRNLVTGASGVDAIIILIDAQNGITDQTRRHSLVASFLGIKNVLVAVNKMDAAGYNEKVYNTIKNDFQAIAEKLGLSHVSFMPVSALLGDNVSFPSAKMDWYKGQTLFQYLEKCMPIPASFPGTTFSVQHTNEAGDICFGKMLSGTLRTGDMVSVLPAGHSATVSSITHGYDEVTQALAGQNISLQLHGVLAKRGDIISHAAPGRKIANNFLARICWMDGTHPLETRKTYFLRINATSTSCVVTEIINKTDVNTFDTYNDHAPLEVNQFAQVRIQTQENIVFDTFSTLPENALGIIIDAENNYTSGAFVIAGE